MAGNLFIHAHFMRLYTPIWQNKKQNMRNEKYQKLAEEVMNKQYALVGLTFDQVKAMSNEEFFKHRITKEQSDEWQKWAVDYIAKKMRWSKAMSKRELGWLDLQMGLSIEINQN